MYQDLVNLNDQIYRINIDMNTQNLRVEVEKIKRQKLRISMKSLINEISPTNKLVTQVSMTYLYYKKRWVR